MISTHVNECLNAALTNYIVKAKILSSDPVRCFVESSAAAAANAIVEHINERIVL